MIGSKTNFYHRNIIKNINDVEKRAERFMSLRLEFIADKCKPLDIKLDQLKIKTKKYASLYQEQQLRIENSQQIISILDDITKFKDLKDYFEKILNQLKHMLFEVENKKLELKDHKRKLKQKVTQTRKSFVLPFINSTELLSSIQNSLSMPRKQVKKKIYMKPSLSTRREKTQSKQQSPILKHQLMEKISKFHDIDYLFQECFQKKKAVVNKMIGHLQSNLVKKKLTFLKVCNTISQEKRQEISFEEFRELNADELLSIIISFPQVTERFMHLYEEKRGKIAQILIQEGRTRL